MHERTENAASATQRLNRQVFCLGKRVGRDDGCPHRYFVLLSNTGWAEADDSRETLITESLPIRLAQPSFRLWGCHCGRGM